MLSERSLAYVAAEAAAQLALVSVPCADPLTVDPRGRTKKVESDQGHGRNAER
jgi:hypothetical protein